MVNLIKIIQGFKTHFVKNRNDSIEIKLDFPLSKLDRHDKKNRTEVLDDLFVLQYLHILIFTSKTWSLKENLK